MLRYGGPILTFPHGFGRLCSFSSICSQCVAVYLNLSSRRTCLLTAYSMSLLLGFMFYQFHVLNGKVEEELFSS